jgi:hypothetical protein
MNPGQQLNEFAQYLSPTGRWCRYVPSAVKTKNVLFLYHLDNGKPAPHTPSSDGFFLSRELIHIMRRVG